MKKALKLLTLLLAATSLSSCFLFMGSTTNTNAPALATQGARDAHVNPRAFGDKSIVVDEKQNTTYNNFILSGRSSFTKTLSGMSIEKIQAFDSSKSSFQLRIIPDVKYKYEIPNHYIYHLRLNDKVYTLRLNKNYPSHAGRLLGTVIDVQEENGIYYINFTADMMKEATNLTSFAFDNSAYTYPAAIEYSAKDTEKLKNFFTSPIKRGKTFDQWEKRNQRRRS